MMVSFRDGLIQTREKGSEGAVPESERMRLPRHRGGSEAAGDGG